MSKKKSGKWNSVESQGRRKFTEEFMAQAPLSVITTPHEDCFPNENGA